MAISAMVAMGMVTASLTACSSSDDESEKNAAKVKEYLAGNEWTINSTSGIYSYYKNHMVCYAGGGGLTPDGYVVEPDVAFGTGRWMATSLLPVSRWADLKVSISAIC